MKRFEHWIAAEELVWKARRDVANQLAEVQQSKRPRVDLALPSFWLKAAVVHEGLARADAEVEHEAEQHAIDSARAVEAALQGPKPARAGRAVRRELDKLRPKPGPPPEPVPGTCEFCGRPRGACAVVPCATARLHGGGPE
jgi:hypothetical protein